jgi:hypothetical protein
MSLEQTEAECAAVAGAPRVSLTDIHNAIAEEYFFTAGQAVLETITGNGGPRASHALDVLTLYILVMTNGFTVIGKSAPASPENFDKELGIKLAREDAIRQLWPLMGYALRDAIHRGDVGSVNNRIGEEAQ